MNNNTLIYEIKDLTKVIDQRNVLQIGRLQIHKGTVYGIIGPLGSGKSALLKLLSGTEKQTSGSLLYDGSEFKTSFLGKIVSPKDIKYVPLKHENDKEKVEQFFNRTLSKKSGEIQNQYFNSGYRRFIWGQTLNSLSFGEYNWIKMIEAIESDPRVLIVENYCSMMDEELLNDLNRRLMRLNKNNGTTIILSSANFATVKRIASVVIFLDKGHISKIRSGIQKNNPNKQRYENRRNPQNNDIK